MFYQNPSFSTSYLYVFLKFYFLFLSYLEESIVHYMFLSDLWKNTLKTKKG